MTDRTTLRVLVFPADDAALRREADAAVADLDQDVPEDLQIAELERRLRRWYRSVSVRRRDSLGGYDDDPTRVWYVYRDGRIRNRHDPLERLYGALADARTTIRASESALRHAAEAAEGVGNHGRRPMPDAFRSLEAVRRNGHSG